MIFCQCALIWKMFELSLGNKFYADSIEEPRSRLVEMFHAGIPSSVKSHILVEIGKEESCLRILVATIAFGMGVDCKDIHRVIHFHTKQLRHIFKNVEELVVTIRKAIAT